MPLLYTADPYGEETSTEPTAGARAAAKSIEIRVGDLPYRNHPLRIRWPTD